MQEKGKRRLEDAIDR